LSRPASTALRMALSISRWQVTPSCSRNLRTSVLNVSSFSPASWFPGGSLCPSIHRAGALG
jgi:hypothetical protein